jgi:hypothetical protein
MLTAPAITTVNGVTVWGDDTDFFKCYLTSAHPRLRLDANGDPVFLLVQYAISDEDRLANPSLPDGAGYMNFDVSFQVTPEEEEAARVEMQKQVDAEWERRRNGTEEERNSHGVLGTTEPPRVEFAAPTYTGGTVNMFAPQSELLVDAMVASGTPDLMSGNIAVFSMDLTEAGSEFMRQTLTGEGGSDLAPIQIASSYTFLARLPPCAISVHCESKRIYDQTRQYMDGAGIDHCTTYQFQNTDMNTIMAEATGLIEVKIDPGSASVPDEVLQELRQYALDMMQQMIESRLFTDDPSEGYFAEFPDGPPDEVLERERGHQRRNKNSKKYFRKNYDELKMNFSLDLQQHSVVEWKINPQSTLEVFFRGKTPEEMKKFVRKIRLDSPFFQNLDLTVKVFGDFENSNLEAVEVALKYAAVDFDGQRRSHEHTLTFTELKAQTWSPSLIGSSRQVEYRVRTKLKGRDWGQFSEPKRTSSNSINVAVASPGTVQRTVAAGALDFATLELQSVEVMLSYEDPELGVPRQEGSVLLTEKLQSGEFSARIDAEPRQPVLYRRRFNFKSGEVIEDDEPLESRSQTLFINHPFDEVMEVRLMPVGPGWREVVQATVELFYEDIENDLRHSDAVTLKTLEDLRVWTVRLRDPDRTDFRYGVNVSYRDGGFEEVPIVEHSGGGVLPIKVREPRTTEVVLVPNRLDFAEAPLTKVVMTHPASGTTSTFTFTEPSRASWTVPVRPDEPLSYTAEVTHFPEDGDPVTLDPTTETDSAFIVPPYAAPKPGQLKVELRPTLIDFTKTPLVTVDVLYEDEENDFRQEDTFAFENKGEARQWVFEVPDVNRRLFRKQITYFVAPDHEPHMTEPEFTTRNLVILPPLKQMSGPAN